VKVSVVIASKDRLALLQRVLESMRPQIADLGGAGEVIVVDDGSTVPYDADALGVRVLRTSGVGPARARNEGVRASEADIVLFTDDDVIVAGDWVASALEWLDAHPSAAGVTGDTTSPPYNPLFEHSVEDHDGGSFLTCNIAYRRAAFVAVGGFDRLFPHAAHEDRDLAWRVAVSVGPVGFCADMRVTHPGRPFTIRAWWRRGALVVDDWLLLARWPERKASRHSLRWAPLFSAAKRWRDAFQTRHALRWLVLAGGQLAVAGWHAWRRWPLLADRSTQPVPGLAFPVARIAYLGPPPDPAAGGAPGVAGLLIGELLTRGVAVDCFVVASVEDDNPRALGDRPGLAYVLERSPFQFARWYSKTRVTKMMSSQIFAAVGRRRLGRRLAALHRASPYDLIYQFSTFELFGVPKSVDAPIVSHPSVHAAGERRWFVREGHQGLSGDPAWRRLLIGMWLAMRVRRQRHDAKRLSGLLAISRTFGDDVARDYAISRDRVRVVPNCIDLDRFPFAPPVQGEGLVAIGRLASRKGWEQVVALSRVSNVPITVIGAPSLWSDYRHLFRAAGPNLVVRGHAPRTDVAAAMAHGTAVVQLSRYEPFGLTVGEALAVGRPVIVTDAVGAAEDLDPHVVRRVAVSTEGAGEDLVAAAAELCALAPAERNALAARCRQEAEQRFSPPVVATQWLEAVGAILHLEPGLR
jgi:glycosyltransferase involved in cell wall biosynthesis/GT2 family glycosyltransferase